MRETSIVYSTARSFRVCSIGIGWSATWLGSLDDTASEGREATKVGRGNIRSSTASTRLRAATSDSQHSGYLSNDPLISFQESCMLIHLVSHNTNVFLSDSRPLTHPRCTIFTRTAQRLSKLASHSPRNGKAGVHIAEEPHWIALNLRHLESGPCIHASILIDDSRLERADQTSSTNPCTSFLGYRVGEGDTWWAHGTGKAFMHVCYDEN